jgi:succinate-acetate transporter protein
MSGTPDEIVQRQPATPAETRIVVRPLATPLPLGLYAFGIGMVMLAAQSAG